MSRFSKRHAAALVALATFVAVGAFVRFRPIIASAQGRPGGSSDGHTASDIPEDRSSGVVMAGPGGTRVSTMRASLGGTPRRSSLPCSAHWHERADLYAKVSGYLAEMNVDIGSRVKQGEVLARIDAPELDRDVDLATANLAHAEAAAKQAAARRKTAAAEQRAAEAACATAETEVEKRVAEVSLRDKEHRRFAELALGNSVQQALVDEKAFQLESARAARRAAETGVLAAREQATAAGARVELADADLEVARSNVQIAEAGLAKAKLLASFAEIISPYDGVVTARRFHRGEFVRAADRGSETPLVSVGRTELIRVVVQIPDREVPFAHPGDPVTVEFDSLSGRTFTGTLARVAQSEDPTTRTMRAEVDLPNHDNGPIIDQMYGRMQIELEPAAQSAMLPSTCLVGDLNGGTGRVFIVRNGTARLQSVKVGAHDGVRFEVLEGLASSDDVVVSPPPGLSDGSAVEVDSVAAAAKS